MATIDGVPLAKAFKSDLFPIDRLDPGQDVVEFLNKILVTSYEDESFEPAPGGRIALGLAFADETVLNLIGLDGFALVIGEASSTLATFDFTVADSGWEAKLAGGARLRFPRHILKPVIQQNESWVDDPSRVFAEIKISAGIVVDQDWNVGFDGANAFHLDAAMLADSGIVIEGDIALDLSENTGLPESAALGLPPAWRGVIFKSLNVSLPDAVKEAVPISALSFKNFHMGSGGVTGSIGLIATPTSGLIGGFPFRAKGFAVELRDNCLTQAEIHGELTLAFFDEPLDIIVGFDLDGNFTIELSADSGLAKLEKPGVFSVAVESLSFGLQASAFTACISGTLTPEIGGLDWPGFKVQELSIDSQGNVRLEGGWLNLRDQYSLNFHGFQFDITRIGFGKTDDGGKWIGFNGGLKLIDGLSAGASVEGLRIAWYDDGRTANVSLDGVGVEFDIPGAVYFKGFVAYTSPTPDEHRFDGSIQLQLKTLELNIDGQLVVGFKGDDPYMAIYLGVELPAGIPLWTTGLGLFGVAGLFAIQMEPGKLPDEAWYAIEHDKSWYHRDPPGVGVTELRKWSYRSGAFALGAGVTLGTVVDNGFTFNGRVLLAIVLPGPILMIEGRANLLRERASLNDEPMFRALVVIDGRAGSFLIGLDAQYKVGAGGELIDIGGSAEVFFKFDDLNAWHIFLGIDEPRERRIRAHMFSLFESNAYFMLSPQQLKLGAWIGYDVALDFGPAHVGFEAWLEGGARLSFKPIHFYGFLWLHGKIEVSVFGIGFHLGADARLEAEVFDPFHLLASIDVSIGLPWPLPDVDFTIKLEWGPEKIPPPLPAVVKEVSVEHLLASVVYPLQKAAGLLTPDFDQHSGFLQLDEDGHVPNLPPAGPPPIEQIPVVPLDARPHITFHRSVADKGLVAVNAQTIAQPEWIGDASQGQGAARISSALTGLAIDRLVGTTWEHVAGSGAFFLDNERKLFGSWAPVPAFPASQPAVNTPQPVGQVKLFVWSKSPFDYARNTTGGWSNWFVANYPNYPCIPVPPNRVVCTDFERLPQPGWIDSPYTAGDLPEVQLGWSGCQTSTRPVVVSGHTAHGRHTSVLFPAGAELVFRTHTLARGTVDSLTLLFDLEDVRAPTETVCVDFSEAAPVTANPRNEGSVVFRTFDGFSPVSNSVVEVRTTPEGRTVVGLNCGSRTTIHPSFYCREARLVIHSNTVPLTVTALGRNKAVVETRFFAGGIDETTEIVLQATRGRVITDVIVSSEAPLLLKTCFAPAAIVEVWSVRQEGGVELLKGPLPLLGGKVVIAMSGADFVRVLVRGSERFDEVGIVGWCADLRLSAETSDGLVQLTKHLENETARLSQRGFVLEPRSTYRLQIQTDLNVDSCPLIPEFEGHRQMLEVAYFRTEGPPGITRLVPPPGNPTPQNFESGLDDLTAYVDQTIPPTVPAPGQRPLLPRPVYRRYDFGVQFRVDYVDQMYRADGRDLQLIAFDNNNRPARDTAGRLLIAANRWGNAEDVARSASEDKWISVIDGSTCLQTDPAKLSQPLSLSSAGQVLLADTLHEVRLVPRLLHEAFLRYRVDQSAAGDQATLAQVNGSLGWQVHDETNAGGPSNWIIGQEAVPSGGQQFFIKQVTNIGATTAGFNRRMGTLLVWRGPNHPDTQQPADWSNYVVGVTIRPAVADGAVGVLFRYQSPAQYYAFVMDSLSKRRRLLRVSGGITHILADGEFQFAAGFDQIVRIEALGSLLRVYHRAGGLDELIFEANDDQIARGGVALYLARCPGSRFADVAIDDFRAEAPVAYRYKFTTSRFVNFFHHMHSYADVLRERTLTGSETVAYDALRSTAVPIMSPMPPIGGAEARSFDTIARLCLGSAANQDTRTVEALRIAGANGTAAVMLRTAEPLDWTRTTLAIQHAPLPPAIDRAFQHPAIKVKLTRGEAAPAGGQPDDELVELTAIDNVELQDWHLQVRVLPGEALPADYAEDFLYPDQNAVPATTQLARPVLNDLTGWEIHDPVSPVLVVVPGIWSAAAGVLTQSADAGIRLLFTPDQTQRGTHAVFGQASWVDVSFKAQLMSGDEDAFGLLFRYRDEQNYYRFSLDRRNLRQRLVRVLNGVFSVLKDAPGGFELNRLVAVEVRAVGPSLVCLVDGVEVIALTDAAHRDGRVGAYCWRNVGATFRDLSVQDVVPRLLDWYVRDDQVPQASHWHIKDHALRQEVQLRALPSPDDPVFASSRLHLNRALGGDYAIEAIVEFVSADVFGIHFRCQPVDGIALDEEYVLLISTQQPGRRLVYRKGSVAAPLYQDSVSVAVGDVVRVRVEAVGPHLAATINGEPVIELIDERIAAGGVALSSVAGPLQVHAVHIMGLNPEWKTYYRFGSEDRLHEGERMTLHGGVAPVAAAVDPLATLTRHAGRLAGQPDSLWLPHAGFEARLVLPADQSGAGHQRVFLATNAFVPLAASVARQADATGVLIDLAAAAMPAGNPPITHGLLRLEWKLHRDVGSPKLSEAGSVAPETAAIDLQV